MKTMKRLKIIATMLTFVFTFVLFVPTYTAAARGWWRPPPPPRYHHHSSWSKSDTAALVILGLGLWAISNQSKSDKPYYEKRQDIINDFNDDELAVLRLIESLWRYRHWYSHCFLLVSERGQHCRRFYGQPSGNHRTSDRYCGISSLFGFQIPVDRPVGICIDFGHSPAFVTPYTTRRSIKNHLGSTEEMRTYFLMGLALFFALLYNGKGKQEDKL